MLTVDQLLVSFEKSQISDFVLRSSYDKGKQSFRCVKGGSILALKLIDQDLVWCLRHSESARFSAIPKFSIPGSYESMELGINTLSID